MTTTAPNASKNTARKTRLGSTGPEVFPVALGCMALSGTYGPTDDASGVATIHAAIDRGIDLLDTGDFYGMGHNEILIGRALQGRRDKVRVSVKFGALRGPDNEWGGVDARPAAVKNFVAYSLKRLGLDVIDIYRPARLDPNVPIEDTIGAIAELIEKGHVRHIGLSEVGVDTIRRAQAVHPIADLQIEYAVISRDPEDKIFPALDELGIGTTVYGVFSRGLLGGSKPRGPKDFRSSLPRFADANQAQNGGVVADLARFAAERGMSPGQVALGWVLARRGRHGAVPLLGSRSVAQLDDALGALERPLSAADVEELERLISRRAIAGTRYDQHQMAQLDSER